MEKHKKRIILILFGLLAIGLAISKAICSLAEVCLFIIAIFEIVYVKKELNKSKFYLFIPSVLFIIYALSGLYSLNYNSFFIQLKVHSPLIIIPFLVWALNDYLEKKKEKLIILFIIGTIFSFSCTVIYTYLPINWIERLNNPKLFLPHTLNSPGLFGMTSIFIDRIQLSNLIGISTLFSIYLGFKRKNYFFLFLTIILFVSSLLLGGRGGQIALFVALIFILSIIITQKLKHYWIIQKTYFLIPLTLISIIITLLFLFSIKNVPFIKERYSQHNYEIKMFETKQYKPEDLINFTSVRRIISWENGIKLIKKHPIFGTGIGDYEEELKKEYDTDNYNLPINHHSQYLFIIGSVGIFIFIIYLLSLLYASFLFFKQKEILPIGIAFLMFYLVAFIPDAVLLRQVDCMSYSLFFSLLLSKIK